MFIYIALLRGVNVSGKNIIKMDALKDLFVSIGAQKVKTYIQSGNVVFESNQENMDELNTKIKGELYKIFGFNVPVILRTLDSLEEIIKLNPYNPSQLTDHKKVYISFLSSKPAAAAVESLISFENEIDDLELINQEVYILCRKGYGNTVYSNLFIEKKLKVEATTRNWNSVNKIAEIARSLGS
jgi:uncharacterized protein (DUF1697 family)